MTTTKSDSNIKPDPTRNKIVKPESCTKYKYTCLKRALTVKVYRTAQLQCNAHACFGCVASVLQTHPTPILTAFRPIRE